MAADHASGKQQALLVRNIHRTVGFVPAHPVQPGKSNINSTAWNLFRVVVCENQASWDRQW